MGEEYYLEVGRAEGVAVERRPGGRGQMTGDRGLNMASRAEDGRGQIIRRHPQQAQHHSRGVSLGLVSAWPPELRLECVVRRGQGEAGQCDLVAVFGLRGSRTLTSDLGLL